MANRRIKDLIEPDNFWVYLVVVVLLLGLAASAFSGSILDLLTSTVKPQWKWLIQLGVVLGALLTLWPIAGLLNLFEALGRSKIAVVGTYPLQETNRGLIVIASVGRGISSAKSAIEFHWNNGQGKLQYCWIISAGDASLASARSLGNKDLLKFPALLNANMNYPHPQPFSRRRRELKLLFPLLWERARERAA
ncbi:hypothetical protein BST81_06695 [Leptolyngbya sp. 'hensonii']|uniref:hypothetical protein n=1 Tax=Leptolyngbya sp. 'hensonii' TaxID=1922337 RepID=UPI00094F9290|nr:hypothetical protein [Leptolyngbya sp. 'hensonii']OLP19181.1 hypothetical protein BST81_06695 [Leptolyngbya sp. 'hensonii']